jgi:hypothetical protein
VATWAEFVRQAPDVAAAAVERWPGIVALERGDAPPAGQPAFAIAYLATVRRDGGPRVHPFCPVLAGGRLFGAIPRTSPKGWDLRRDPRCAIHAGPGPSDDELCLRARPSEVADEAVRAMVVAVAARSGVGGMLETASNDPLFELDLEQVDVASWVDVGQPGTHALRAQWPLPDLLVSPCSSRRRCRRAWSGRAPRP